MWVITSILKRSTRSKIKMSNRVKKGLLESIGEYTLLIYKTFSSLEKRSIYKNRIISEMIALGLDSVGLTAIISFFIGAVITLQMSINLEASFVPPMLIGYATRETMILEFSSTVVALILAEEFALRWNRAGFSLRVRRSKRTRIAAFRII